MHVKNVHFYSKALTLIINEIPSIKNHHNVEPSQHQHLTIKCNNKMTSLKSNTIIT